ncbi:MAG: sugar transferase [Promethearchaeota archaeon]
MGLAQINGRGLLSFKKTLKIDVKYVEDKSLWMNIKVLMKTVYDLVTCNESEF